MTASSTRVHMALGQGDYSFDYHPELVAVLKRGWHLWLYEGEEVIDLGVIPTEPEITADEIKVTTRGVEWHLGGETVGHLIEEKEFVNGVNKLSNPDFSRGLNEWDVPEETLWALQGSQMVALAPPPPDPFAPATLEDEPGDDIFSSEESWKVKPGYEYNIWLYGYRDHSSGAGRLRLRVVWDGNFQHPELAKSYTAWRLATSALQTALPSGLFADVRGHGRDGTPVIQWPDTGGANQTWRLEDHGGGEVYIISAESGLALDVFGEGIADGTAVIVWPFHGRANQRWVIEPHETNPFFFRLRSVHSGRYLTVPGDSPTQGVGLEIWLANGAIGQYWFQAPRGGMTRFSGGDPLGVFGESIRIQSQRPNLVRNSDFANGLADWIQTGTWGTVSGPHGISAYTDGGGPTFKDLKADADPHVEGLQLYPVKAGETYWFEGWCAPTADTDGAGIVTLYVGDPTVDATGPWDEILRIDSSYDQRWRFHGRPVTIPEGVTHIGPQFSAHNHTTGRWMFANMKLFRTHGNIDRAYGPYIPVSPERNYKATVPYYSDVALEEGLVQMRAVAISATRPPIALDGPPLGLSGGHLQRAEWDLSTPSGYDGIFPVLWSSDVITGAVWAGPWSIRDSSTETAIGDLVSSNTAAAAPDLLLSDYVTAPKGSKKVHLEVVKETDSTGWHVTYVGIARTGTPIATGESVVRDCLRNERTGGALLPEGRIGQSGRIWFDYEVLNQTKRQLLTAVSRVGLTIPPREWRFNVEDASLDWDIAEALCTDWAPDSDHPVVFEEDGFYVVEPLQLTRDDEEAAQAVKVIGNVVETTDLPIVGTADETDPEALGWFNEPQHRTLVVSESSLDHPSLAAAYAAYRLALQQPRLTVTIILNGVRLLPKVQPGDWVYLYKPEAGLSSNDHQYTTARGRVINPMRLRITEIRRNLSRPSHRLVVRRPDGSTYDIPSDWVHWEDEDSVELVLGDRPPEFATDPQGGAAGRQLLRFLASSPRFAKRGS